MPAPLASGAETLLTSLPGSALWRLRVYIPAAGKYGVELADFVAARPSQVPWLFPPYRCASKYCACLVPTVQQDSIPQMASVCTPHHPPLIPPPQAAQEQGDLSSYLISILSLLASHNL